MDGGKKRGSLTTVTDADFNEQVLLLREILARLDLVAIDRDQSTGFNRLRVTARGRKLQPDLERLHAALRGIKGDRQDLLDTALVLLINAR